MSYRLIRNGALLGTWPNLTGLWGGVLSAASSFPWSTTYEVTDGSGSLIMRGDISLLGPYLGQSIQIVKASQVKPGDKIRGWADGGGGRPEVVSTALELGGGLIAIRLGEIGVVKKAADLMELIPTEETPQEV